MNGCMKAKRSDIHITERTSSGTKRILDQNALCIDTQINHIIQSGVPRWGEVIQSDGAGQGVVTLGAAAARWVLVLPYPPGTVDLRMM